MKKQIRGGFSGVLGDRHVKANNKYLEDYDNTKPSNYLLDVDGNSLYPNGMSKDLPTGNFNWEDENCCKTGKPCTVECDLEYPQNVKKLTYKYPLLPEKKSIDNKELSVYQKELLENLNEKNSKTEKLILDLTDKKKYVVYHKTLKYYESMEIKIKKIYETISFDESPWLKPYIDNNLKKNVDKQNTEFEKSYLETFKQCFLW